MHLRHPDPGPNRGSDRQLHHSVRERRLDPFGDMFSSGHANLAGLPSCEAGYNNYVDKCCDLCAPAPEVPTTVTTPTSIAPTTATLTATTAETTTTTVTSNATSTPLIPACLCELCVEHYNTPECPPLANADFSGGTGSLVRPGHEGHFIHFLPEGPIGWTRVQRNQTGWSDGSAAPRGGAGCPQEPCSTAPTAAWCPTGSRRTLLAAGGLSSRPESHSSRVIRSVSASWPRQLGLHRDSPGAP